jgi:AcrR family transcriptional regulator
MPKLWNDTIAAHRREVREAIIETTAALVAEHGLLSVTMSRIAETTGIGRATLYKYFPDVESVLVAWHERGIATHLAQLTEARDRAGGGLRGLQAVLEAFALIEHEHHGSQEHHGHLQDRALEAVLHSGRHVERAHHHLHAMLVELVTEAAEAGEVRHDVAPSELANYCLHSLSAASSLGPKAAVRRLVGITLDGLRPTR